MVDQGSIHEGMEVLGSDGGMIGRVDRVHDDHIHLQPTSQLSGAQRFAVPLAWVARADDHVHLDRPAALARDEWMTVGEADAGAGAAAPAGDGGQAAAHTGGGRDWSTLFPWVAGLFSLALAVLLGVRACSERNANDVGSMSKVEGARTAAATPVQTVPVPGLPTGAGAPVPLTAGSIGAEVERYLVGTEVAPRTFVFQELNFDTSSAAIRPENRATIIQLGQVLVAHPTARVRVVGYADARGAEGANANLGLARARAVATALTATGVPATRIESTSGGETNPEASNATAPGQSENRRTELVILSR